MAYIAHSYGATIEGELGHVGDNESSAEATSNAANGTIDFSAFFTDPAAVSIPVACSIAGAKRALLRFSLQKNIRPRFAGKYFVPAAHI